MEVARSRGTSPALGRRGRCTGVTVVMGAGGKGLRPGQHAGLPLRAGAGGPGKSLSVKGRLMKKLRLG